MDKMKWRESTNCWWLKIEGKRGLKCDSDTKKKKDKME
jgi:hypothetical protein